MRRRVIALFVLIAGTSGAFLAQDQPTFRTGTTLVEFTVVALDGKGNPITDLSKEDLTLTDRGQPRDVAFFRFDGDGTPSETAAPLVPLSPGFVTNRPEYQPEPQRNVTAIVLDLINTAPPDQNGARAQLLRYLKALPANTPVGLFQFSETAPITMLESFTRSTERIRTRMASLDAASRRELVTPGAKAKPIVGGECGSSGSSGPVPGAGVGGTKGSSGSGTMAEGMSAFTESESRTLTATNQTIRGVRLSQTLTSLEMLANHLSGIPGRKNVVLISSGMPIHFPPAIRGQAALNFEPRLRPTAQRLANAGVAVYPVDAKGGCRALDTTKDQGFYGLNDAPQHVFGTFDVIADVTGGRVVKHTNDLSQGITLAANDLRGTYTVGFYVPDEPDDRWHAIKVATRRRGVALRHRQGYLSAARTQPQSLTPDAWTDLARAPLGSSGIRLNGRPTLGVEQVTVLLQIAAGDLYFSTRDGRTIADLEIALVEKTETGPTNVRQQPLEVTLNDPAKDQRAALISTVTTWPLNAATTAIRVIVRDRFTGRYGALDLPVTRSGKREAKHVISKQPRQKILAPLDMPRLLS